MKNSNMYFKSKINMSLMKLKKNFQIKFKFPKDS